MYFIVAYDAHTVLQIFINGSEPHTYVEVPFRASNKPATTNASSIIFGKRQLGPFRVTSALLDEVKLWYRPISDEDFRSSIAFESQSYGKSHMSQFNAFILFLHVHLFC